MSDHLEDNKEIGELLSALVDGELTHDETIPLLELLKREPVLKEKWRNYHLIRECLGGHNEGKNFIDLAQRVRRVLSEDVTAPFDSPMILKAKATTEVAIEGRKKN